MSRGNVVSGSGVTTSPQDVCPPLQKKFEVKEVTSEDEKKWKQLSTSESGCKMWKLNMVTHIVYFTIDISGKRELVDMPFDPTHWTYTKSGDFPEPVYWTIKLCRGAEDGLPRREWELFDVESLPAEEESRRPLLRSFERIRRRNPVRVVGTSMSNIECRRPV